MQKNLNFFFVQYSQQHFHPLNPGLFSKPQQYPPGTPSVKDAARVFVYPALDPQGVVLCYPGKVRPSDVSESRRMLRGGAEGEDVTGP